MALRPSQVQGPLNGVVVVDLTHVLSGPYGTMLLAEMGARVIKVEGPGKEDVARQLGPFVNGRSAYFATMNRGKEAVCLDLKAPEDRRVLERILSGSDILIENFTPGVMDRLGLGWEALHERYPRLIYAAISGFGRTGPLSGRKSNDLVAQAMGGVMSLTGPKGGPAVRVGTSMADMTSGLFAVTGICAALYHREQTGQGLLIDVSMVDGQISLLEHNIARYVHTGRSPAPMGNKHPSVAPFGAYDTADGRLIVATAIDKDFKVLAEVLGRPDLLDDPRFRDLPARAANQDDLDAELAGVLRSRTTESWLHRFQGKGLRVAPINNVEAVVNHPQTRARRMVVTTTDPVKGEVKMPGNPIKMSAFPDPVTRPPAPDVGEHTDQIKSELDAEG
jgi:CoA:oxalate CoA-transferase